MKITYDTVSDSISCPDLTPDQTRALQSELSAALNAHQSCADGGRPDHGGGQGCETVLTPPILWTASPRTRRGVLQRREAESWSQLPVGGEAHRLDLTQRRSSAARARLIGWVDISRTSSLATDCPCRDEREPCSHDGPGGGPTGG